MRIPLIIAAVVLLSPARAQFASPALEAPGKLDELNAAFDGRVRFDYDRAGRLVADHYDQTGRFRQDVVYLEHLDPSSVTWITEESAIVVKCLASEEQCIVKELFKSGKVVPTARMNMNMPAGDPARERAMDALRSLISGEQERLARNARETKARPARKK